jgi:hypothetical protein
VIDAHPSVTKLLTLHLHKVVPGINAESEVVKVLAASPSADAALPDVSITIDSVESQLAAMELHLASLTHSSLPTPPPPYFAEFPQELPTLPRNIEFPSPTLSSASTETPVDGPSALSVHDFDILGPIGAGSFSTVHKVKHTATGRISALKVIPKADLCKDRLVCVEQEQECLKRAIGMKGVLQLEASFHDSNNFYLLTVCFEDFSPSHDADLDCF